MFVTNRLKIFEKETCRNTISAVTLKNAYNLLCDSLHGGEVEAAALRYRMPQ